MYLSHHCSYPLFPLSLLVFCTHHLASSSFFFLFNYSSTSDLYAPELDESTFVAHDVEQNCVFARDLEARKMKKKLAQSELTLPLTFSLHI